MNKICKYFFDFEMSELFFKNFNRFLKNICIRYKHKEVQPLNYCLREATREIR